MSTRIHDAGLKSYQACTHLFYLHVQANPMLQKVPLFAILRSSGKHDKHTCGAAMQTTAPIRDQPHLLGRRLAGKLSHVNFFGYKVILVVLRLRGTSKL